MDTNERNVVCPVSNKIFVIRHNDIQIKYDVNVGSFIRITLDEVEQNAELEFV